MRITGAANGLTLTVYAGTTGTHLAWDAEPALLKGLLGFAIRRTGASYPKGIYLMGGIGFPGQNHQPGYFLDTSVAPIQAFRWGDYTVYPDTSYTYELIPMYEPWNALTPGPSVSVKARTERVDGGRHRIAFNRAVAASQAYERHFDGADPHENGSARQWLGRGLDAFIQSYFERATDAAWALDVVMYQYELPEIRDSLRAARDRGVTVRIIYHAQPDDAQTARNTANIGADGFGAVAKARITPSICHHKTVVLSRLDAAGNRTPQAVLTGSTNWTFNGLYYQGNVGHVIDDPALAARFLELFEQLYQDPTSQAHTRTWIGAHDPIAEPPAEPEAILSPRPNRTDLARYVDLIDGAKRTLLFMTTFALDAKILSALAGEDTPGSSVLRYGLQNTASRVTGYDRAHDRTFTATGKLRSAVHGFLPESAHGQDGNILVHGKIILIDFDTAQPIVVTGSANYSYSSSNKNDENALVIRGDTRVADIYLCEVFRLFDHYRFRYNVSHPLAKAAAPGAPPAAFAASSTSGTVTPRFELDTTNAWTDDYYDDPESPHALGRVRLAHPTP